MKIFITGSNGMLGSELCKQLSKKDVKIYGSGRGENRLKTLSTHPAFMYSFLDISDTNQTKEIINAISPDLIIHCAAMTQVDDCELNKTACLSINVDATKTLLHIAEELNCRFIYISTDFVFNGEKGPYKESDEPNPVNFYGQSKLLAEELVMQSDVAWSIVRTVLLYGKTEQINRSNFIYWVRDNLTDGKKINVVNDQIRTPTFIPDLASAIIAIIERSAEGIFHVSGNETMTPYEISLKVARFLGLNTNLIQPVDSNFFTQSGRRPLKTGFIIEKAQKVLGFNPLSVDQAFGLIFEK